MSWNRSSGAPKVAPKKKPSAMRGIVAGLVVVCALGGLCLWMFSGGEDAPKSKADKERGRIKEVTPAVKCSSSAGVARPVAKASGNTGEPSDADTVRTDVVASETEQVESSPDESVPLKNGTDQLIGMLMNGPPDAIKPPLPGIPREETEAFIENLKKPIVIDENDTERVKRLKELVKRTREEILQILEENPGMSFADVLQEHRKIHNENVDIKGRAETELQQIVESGDIEGAKKYRTVMDAALQQMGIDGLTTPITEKEKAEAEEMERLEQEDRDAMDREDALKREMLKNKKEAKK